MKKKIILALLILSIVLNMASCMDFLTSTQANMTGSGSDNSSTITTLNGKLNIDDDREEEYYGVGASTLKKYNDILLEEEIPEYFIYYDQLSEWGMFSGFGSEGTRLNQIFEVYHYTLYDGYSGVTVKLTVDHRKIPFYEHFTYTYKYMEGDFIVLTEHPEDDFRTCSYTEGNALYVENNIAYYYTKGNLRFICWMYNDIMFAIENPGKGSYENGEYIPPNFKSFKSWRNWQSLFMYRVSANRAIEFFGMMLDGELPTIEEVFGPAQDEHGNPINNTPCEITWQKPDQVA